jgi:uncharacterized protein with NAD-binding domain and iron-sulfur cluster
VAPIYDVLKRRGVRFAFFSRVRSLHLDAGGDAIGRIVIERQATPTSGTYEPLIDVNDLPCWPSQPLFDQLVEGEELKARGVNLESWWTDWCGPTYELTRGQDFDEVLLGISIAALPHICGELVEASAAWRTMVEQVQTNRPVIVQTWQTRSIADLGFRYGVINGDTGTEPINLLTSMDQILGVESWRGSEAPASLIYYSGVMPDDPHEPPAPDPAYPPTQQATLRDAAVAFLESSAQIYLPEAATPDGAFDWNVLACPGDPSREGRARLDEQYWRVNIDPSERYVLSVTGSSACRMAAGGSGYANLFLAGDWLETGLNSGCMEATVTSGLEAAHAIAEGGVASPAGARGWRGAPASGRAADTAP